MSAVSPKSRRRAAPPPSTGLGVDYAASPLLASRTPNWRSRFLVAAVALGFGGLLGRAAWVQLVNTEFLLQKGEQRYAHRVEVPATRGRILDRDGQLLATSVPVPSIWAIPKQFDATPEQRAAMLRILGMSAREFDERMASGSANFAWIRRQAEPAQWQQLAELGIKGLYEDHSWRRRYPEGESAAHVVGFTDLDDQGVEGIERAFEKQLKGHAGTRGVVRDRLGRVVEDLGLEVEPAEGRDVQLSIDAKLQFFAYKKVREAVAEHKAKAGSVVVLDAQTGEVLALANWPSFDPAARARLKGEQLRNRALTDIFEPGSTVKPFIVAQALDTGRVTPQTMVDARAGSLVISGFTIKDTHPQGMLSVQQVIQKSSNVGVARLAMQMPSREMWEVFTKIGYGQRPQIDFPGAVSGKLRPYKSWRPIEQATMAYGYGLSASLLQMARAYTAFARDGEVIPVTMLKRKGPMPGGVRVFSPATAREMRTMLHMATEEAGTGRRAQTMGFSVGGKSGTAHKQEGSGYASDKYRSWFVGMAPIDKPRIIVAVMVDEPKGGAYYGGTVAGPVFSDVVQQTLRVMGVTPDAPMTPQVMAQAPAQPGLPIAPIAPAPRAPQPAAARPARSAE